MEAVINALTNGKDYSNGAIRWDGFDLAARGFNHPKPKTAGVEISPADFMHFKAAWPAKLMVMSEKVCKILLVLSLMLGVPQA